VEKKDKEKDKGEKKKGFWGKVLGVFKGKDPDKKDPGGIR